MHFLNKMDLYIHQLASAGVNRRSDLTASIFHQFREFSAIIRFQYLVLVEQPKEYIKKADACSAGQWFWNLEQ